MNMGSDMPGFGLTSCALGGSKAPSVKWKKEPTMNTCSRSLVLSQMRKAFVGKHLRPRSVSEARRKFRVRLG